MTKIQIDQLGKDEAAASIGSQLQPLFTWQGRDFYPVRGAEDDDDGDGDPDGEPGNDDNDDEGEGADKSGSDKPVSREDFERQKRQLQAADKKRVEAEKALKAIEDSKKDELTKATERAEELQKLVEDGKKENADLRLQNAFLSANEIIWHDPADALALAERRGYLDGVVDEDGTVDSSLLGKKLKEMAKAKPNLVKTAGDDDSGSGDSSTDKPKAPKTGAPVGGKGKGGKGDEPNLARYDKFLTR
jgi:hypothetical protein